MGNVLHHAQDSLRSGQVKNPFVNHSPTRLFPMKMQNLACSAGDGHTCAIAEGGAEIHCFGRNDYGQAEAPLPTAPSPSAAAAVASHVCAGAHHSCAAWQAPAAAPTVLCWGDDRWGMTRPPVLGAGRVTALHCGSFHTCALLTPADDGAAGAGGRAVCWGRGAAATVPPRWAAEAFVSLTTGCVAPDSSAFRLHGHYSGSGNEQRP